MDLAGKLAKVSANDPTALPAAQLFAMATIDGARVLGMQKRWARSKWASGRT
jgi:cytosine/adenosine deaminase-related metal-dependent hydrolase